jgi:hypothetical protein
MPRPSSTIARVLLVTGGKSVKPNLVVNGDFSADATGWTAQSGATLDSVAGGQAGNCLRITGAFKNAYQCVLALSGTYTLELYHKNGDANGYVAVGTSAGATDILDPGAALDEAGWTKHTYTFTRTGNAYISLFTWVGSTITYFDSIRLTKN